MLYSSVISQNVGDERAPPGVPNPQAASTFQLTGQFESITSGFPGHCGRKDPEAEPRFVILAWVEEAEVATLFATLWPDLLLSQMRNRDPGRKEQPPRGPMGSWLPSHRARGSFRHYQREPSGMPGTV